MANTVQIKVDKNGIKEALPSGYTAPTFNHTFTADSIKIQGKEFVVAASGNVNATPSTGLTNCITALDAAVDTFIGAGDGNMGVDVSTNTVKTAVTITNCVRRSIEGTESKFETGGDELVFTCDIEYEVTA